jgi:hypothetical protein
MVAVIVLSVLFGILLYLFGRWFGGKHEFVVRAVLMLGLCYLLLQLWVPQLSHPLEERIRGMEVFLGVLLVIGIVVGLRALADPSRNSRVSAFSLLKAGHDTLFVLVPGQGGDCETMSGLMEALKDPNGKGEAAGDVTCITPPGHPLQRQPGGGG